MNLVSWQSSSRGGKTAPIPSVPSEWAMPAMRLVVILPGTRIDEIALARLVWGLGVTYSSDILYLCVVQNTEEELRALHQLARLYALTQDPRFRVETSILQGLTWSEAIRSVWKPGDLMICYANHSIRSRFFARKWLSRWLAEEFHLPVYALTIPAPPESIKDGKIAATLGQSARFAGG